MEMQPIENFEWSLWALRKMFKLISQDIFQVNYRRGLLYYIILMHIIFALVCAIFKRSEQQNDLVTYFNIGILVPVFAKVIRALN